MANSASINNISVDLTELSADTSPQLGGNLDLNSNNITGTGNINTTGTITASSTITGSTFSGSGASLTNLPSAQLTGALPAIDGSNLTGINTDLVADTTPQLGGNLDAQSNNITNLGTINTHTIPSGTDTLVGRATTDTLTSKTINLSSNTLSGTTAQFNTALSDGSFRVGYQPGEVIEEISATCDGSTVVVQSGSYAMTNVTAVQNGSTTYTTVTGSSISYTPPTGTKRVYYRFWYHYDVTENSGISHHIMQIDGTDVYGSSNNVASNYASSNWHHACFPISVEYTINCDASSTSATAGQFTSWTSAKTLRVQYREYSGSYESRLHINTWWNGSGSSNSPNNQIMKPHLTIRAIA